jgi:hypothetical protein
MTSFRLLTDTMGRLHTSQQTGPFTPHTIQLSTWLIIQTSIMLSVLHISPRFLMRSASQYLTPPFLPSRAGWFAAWSFHITAHARVLE